MLAARVERSGGGLAALRGGDVNAADAVHLTCGVDARHRRLERAARDRHLDRALLAAKHELDRLRRTAAHAVAVADARRWLDQSRPAVDHCDHVAFGTRIDARARADARVCVDARVDRWWRHRCTGEHARERALAAAGVDEIADDEQ